MPASSSAPPPIQHVVVSNQPDHPVLRQLHADAAALGWSPIVVLGDPSVRCGPPSHFGPKLTLMMEWLRRVPAADQIVLFTDAHDVRVTARPEAVLAAYRSYAGPQGAPLPVVLSAERNCWPDERAAAYYATHRDSRVVYKYVNSGGYIGPAGALLALLTAADAEEPFTAATDDQGAWTRIYLTHQASVRLDTECRIFQSLHLAENDVDATSGMNQRTGTLPLVWHGNSGAAFFRDVVRRWPVGGPAQTPRRSAEAIARYLSLVYQAAGTASPPPVAWDLADVLRRDHANSAVLWYLYGLVLEKQCDLRAACSAYQEAVRIEQHFAVPVFSLAEYYVHTGRPIAARDCLLSCVYRRPTVSHPNAAGERPTVRLMDQLRAVSLLGPIYEAAGDTAAARGVYTDAYDALILATDGTTGLSATNGLNADNRQRCSDIWSIVCDSLARLTQNDPDATLSPRYRAQGHAGLWAVGKAATVPAPVPTPALLNAMWNGVRFEPVVMGGRSGR